MESRKGSQLRQDNGGRFRSTVAYYDRYRLDYPQRLLARVAAVAGLGAGDPVLDLGTGTGMLAVGVARLVIAVIALDPEPEMLAAAALRAKAAGASVDFREGSSAGLH